MTMLSDVKRLETIRVISDTWNDIAADMVAVNGGDMTRSECCDAVCDYVELSRSRCDFESWKSDKQFHDFWWDLSSDQRDELTRAAIKSDYCS